MRAKNDDAMEPCSTYRSHLLDRRGNSRRVDRGGADGGVLDGAQHQAVARDDASRDFHIRLRKKARERKPRVQFGQGLGKRGGVTPISMS